MAAIFLCSLWVLPPLVFVLSIALLLLISAWEWADLAYLQRPLQRVGYVVITGLLLLIAAIIADVALRLTHLTMNVEMVCYLLSIAVGWWALAFLWLQSYPSSAVLWGSRWMLALMGWLVLIPSWLALVYLRSLDNGSGLILLVVMTVVIADVGAYFFGKLLGKHPLASVVSPGKSWEGLWGGLVACAVFAVLTAWAVEFSQWRQLLIIVVIVALASIIGDLVESMVKRHRGIKDSGSILPGHGGILDRIDGLTAALPVFALAVILADWKS